MNELSPNTIFQQLSCALPTELHSKIVIIGSLAAAYHFFQQDPSRGVRTKDIDCLLRPHQDASVAGAQVARRLLENGWTHRSHGDWGRPQPTPEPKDKLAVVRLYPPHDRTYFVELLADPPKDATFAKDFIPIEVHDQEYFCLATFRYLTLTSYMPYESNHGIYYARPSMMALSNLLSHPTIADDVMSSPYGDRSIKRSNKDVGRVLALAFLASRTEENWTDQWLNDWSAALKDRFPTQWQPLAKRAGDGLHALLDSPSDFEEAYYTCIYGLLSADNVTQAQLHATAQRILSLVVNDLD